MEDTKLQRILMEIRTELDMLLHNYYSASLDAETKQKLIALISQVDNLQTSVTSLNTADTDITARLTIVENKVRAMQNQSETGNPEISASDVTALQTAVESIQNSIQTLNQTTSQHSNDISALQSAVTSNQTNIQNLSQSVTQNTQDISTLQTNVQTNTSNISSLQTAVQTNSTDIEDLQTSTQTNTQDISELNSTLAEHSEQLLDHADRIGTMEQYQTTISTNALKIAINTENISKLMAFRDSMLSPADPYYNPKSFSDYPAGTILQGYAKYSEVITTSMNSKLKTPEMVFSAEEDSSGKLFFRLKFSVSTTFSGTINLYQNENLVYQEQYDFENTSNEYDLERNIYDLTLEKINVFYVQITAPVSSTRFTFKYIESQLVAPNAEVINQLSPYTVEYFENKYYISDCSSGKAKTAVINVSDMHNMANLTWVDTGIECLKYNFSFGIKFYADTYKPVSQIDSYRSPDSNLYLINKETNVVSKANSFNYIDWLPVYEERLNYVGGFKNSRTVCVCFYQNDEFSYVFSNNQKAYVISAGKIVTNQSSELTNNYITSIKYSGDILVELLTLRTVQSINIGMGTNPHLYIKSFDKDSAEFECYFKYYDKIIRKDISYTKNNGFELISTTEIGAYEEYFEGVNNDYFVVRAGKLEYHKKNNS